MIKQISYKDKQVIVSFDDHDSRVINLGITIWDLIFIDQHIVVLLRPKELSGTKYHNRNILCLDEQGREIWRVDNPDLLSISKTRTTANSFSTMFLKDDMRLRVGTSGGYEVDLDIKTGKFIGDWQFTK